MADPLQTISQLLAASLQPATHKDAERSLAEEERKPEFSLNLLRIVASDDTTAPYAIRLAAALCFKNFVRRNWVDENGTYKLPENEVTAVKNELVGLMVSVAPGLQSVLGEAISLIAESDFYQRWETLVDDLVSRLTVDNTVVNQGVLQVAHSIFKRWRPLFRSDELFSEILYVLNKFGPAYLKVFETTDALIEQKKDDKAALTQLFGTLNLIIKLFYDLSCQDLPELFEDNLNTILTLLHKYLTYSNPLLSTDDDAESGPLEYVKAGIFEVLVLYGQKYLDAFESFVPQFVSSSWTLLTNTGIETKYDVMVSKALQFLTTVAKVQQHAQNFKDEGVLQQVLEGVILPNVTLRESDEELFEDEPIEYIRRDLEGSDSDTRRRAATDFLRALLSQFDELVTGVVMKYVTAYLGEYEKNKEANWKSKDTAVYLFSAIAATGVVTASQGVKQTNALVNVIDFFQTNIASDLVSETATQPILRVGAIKYLYNFRSQMTKEQWHSAFPMLARHLGDSNYVVYTYASIMVERVLAMTTESREPFFSRADVEPLSVELLNHLFKLIEQDQAPEKVQENEFLMRCVMRVLTIIKEGLLPQVELLSYHLQGITKIISKNPSNPRFYYYHFEAVGAVVRYSGTAGAATVYKSFFPAFIEILQQDTQEFIPYVFQLLAAMIEFNDAGSLIEDINLILQPILLPPLWESKGNVPALTRLLSDIILRWATRIVEGNQIEPILGVFQKLVSSKANESFGFDILEALVEALPVTALQPYFTPLLNIILTRLQGSRTETFAVRFVRFYHLVSSRDKQGLGADFFAQLVEQMQTGLFTTLYLSVILAETPKIASYIPRKIAVASLTRTLISSVAFAEKYKKGWGFTVETLLKVVELPPLPVDKSDSLPIEQDVDDLSFGVGFTPLATCRAVPRDPYQEMLDARKWVGEEVKKGDQETSGRVSSFIEERLDAEKKEVLKSYVSLAG